MKRTNIVSVRLSDEEVRKIDEVGRKLGFDRSTMIRFLIHMGLRDLKILGVSENEDR